MLHLEAGAVPRATPASIRTFHQVAINEKLESVCRFWQVHLHRDRDQRDRACEETVLARPQPRR